MRLLLLILLFGASGLAQAQFRRTLYFDAEGKETTIDNAYFNSTITRDKKDTTLYQVETLFFTGERMASGGFKARHFPVAWEKMHVPTFRDALKDGLFREYHRNGKLQFEGAFKAGRGEGRHRRWYESGKLLSEGTLTGGLDKSTMTSYYESGQPKSQYLVKDGKGNGEWIEYHENGKKKAKTTIRNGRREGEPVRYDGEEKEIPKK